MAKPNRKTSDTDSGGTEDESALAVGETAGSDQNLVDVNQGKTASDTRDGAAEASQADADWGFSSGRTGMAKETKIGLALCMLLIGALAFVVYSKMNPRQSVDGIDDHVVQSDDDLNDGSDGSSTSGDDPPVQETVHEHEYEDKFTQRQHGPSNDNIDVSQDEPVPSENSNTQQQPSPWESHAKGHRQTAARNVSQTSQSRQDDPFSTTSQNQTVERQESDDELHAGSTQQQQPVEIGNIDENHHQSHAQQATDEDDPFGAEPTRASHSETPNHEDHQHQETGKYNPFADPKSEQQVDADMQQTEPHTEQSQLADQNDSQQDFTQHTHENSKQQNRYYADTEEPAPYGPTGEFDTDPHKYSPSQTVTDSARSEFGSSADETHRENEWSHHPHPSNDSTEQQQQSAEQQSDLADPFDTHAPTQHSVEQDFGEPDDFSQQSQSADHVDQHHEQSNDGNAYQQRSEFDSHLTKSADATTGNYADRPSVYVVRSGDNYWNISRKQYGAGRYYKALARYNRQRIPDPQKMRPGMNVLVPSRELLEQRFPERFPRRRTVAASGNPGGQHKSPGFFTSTTGEMLYRVGRNDTLTGIANRHLGRASRWVQIYGLNRSHISDPGRLKIGTVLHLPADASRVQLVRDPRGHR